MTNGLNPCPRCGQDAGVINRVSENIPVYILIGYFVYCSSCRAATKLFDDKANAIYAWDHKEIANQAQK